MDFRNFRFLFFWRRYREPWLNKPKISYTWWSLLQDCFHKNRGNAGTWEDHINGLFSSGLQELQRSKDLKFLNGPNDIFARTNQKTITVTLNEISMKAINKYVRETGYDADYIIGHCLRLGYNLTCKRM